MIIIHLPNGKKGGGFLTAQDDLLNDCFQSRICGHKVYKVAQNSNVNHVLPNVLALVDGLLKKLLESQTDTIRAHNMREMSKSLGNFKWQRSHICGLEEKRPWKVEGVGVGGVVENLGPGVRVHSSQ